ncbi:MAG: type IV secretory system conjugative DNA transfer family protein [Bacteroidota bacterium]
MDENNQRLWKLFGMFQAAIYVSIAVEILLYIFYDFYFFQPVYPLFEKFWKLKIYEGHNILYSKLFTLFLILLTSIGTRPKKNLEIKVSRQVLLPIFLGLIIFFASSYFYFFDVNFVPNNVSNYEIAYTSCAFVGAVVTHAGVDNISKLIRFKLGDDKFNDENESFEQNKKLIENEYSVNLPMEYYHKGRMNKGWFNITNLFRGTIVIGIPESGKSFSVIAPAIKQTIRKGFTQLIYDYKYPDFAEMAYYHHLRMKKEGKTKNYRFHVVNLSNIEYSRRVNPLSPKYFSSLSHAVETAEALVYAMQKKSEGNSSGADQFFSQSSINFLAATFYFFSKFEGGKYSTLPHVLFFLNLEYEEIFDVLTTDPELDSLLTPFLSAYHKKTYEQLEGQLGTLRVNLGKMNTKESAWVFSGDDVDLNISNPKSPSIFVIGNSRDTQSTNSAINSLLLNRLIKLINKPGNIPITVSVDELPTIFFYKIQELIATARSNKVAVILGLQELPQLVEMYGKTIADSVTSVVGNVISGSVRNTNTLQWLEKLFGKSKQLKKGISINRKDVSTSVNEQMDFLIPSSKIADLKTGQVVAKLAHGYQQRSMTNQNMNTYRCSIEIDVNEVKKEEKNYVKLPKYYNFSSEIQRDKLLLSNYLKIKDEVEYIVSQF